MNRNKTLMELKNKRLLFSTRQKGNDTFYRDWVYSYGIGITKNTPVTSGIMRIIRSYQFTQF